MSIVKKSAVAVALASVVTAQTTSSVVNLFFPDSEGQQLIGSVVASDASLTTLAVACDPSATATDCYLDGALTVTVGPSTFFVQETLEEVTVALDCVVDGTTAATCSQTYIGPADSFEFPTSTDSAAAATNTGLTTSSETTVLAQSEINFIPVTIVDDLGVTEAATTGASGTASTASNTGSSTRTSSGSSTASQTSGTTSSSGTATATGNSNNAAARANIHTLAFTLVGAGLLGLTAVFL